MKESRLRPRVVLWWGVGLTAAGLVLAVLVPQLLFVGYLSRPGANPDQTVLAVVDVLTRASAEGVVPLGVALIGASLVMTYVTRLLGARVAEGDPVAQDR